MSRLTPRPPPRSNRPGIFDRLRIPRPDPVKAAAATTIAAAVVLVITRSDDGGLLRHAGSPGAWSPYTEYLRTIDLWSNPHLDTRIRLYASDGPYPPLLHYVMAPLGSLVGHGDVAITRLMFIWVLALAGAVGVTARCLSGDSRTGWIAAAAVATVPAVASLGLVYFHDLPMAAMCWWIVAAIFAIRRRSPEAAGVAAGLLCFAAGFAKWTALPLIPTLVGGALLTHLPGEAWSWKELGRRLRVGAVAVLVCVLMIQGWFDISTTSWESMSATTMQDAEAFGGSEGAVSFDAVKAVWYRMRWSGYPVWAGGLLISTVTHVLSPLLAVLLLLGVGRWVIKDRRAWPLIALVFVGQLTFFVTLVPVADSRMLLPALPSLVIAAVLGLQAAPRGVRLAAAAVWVGVALSVLVDVHHLPEPTAFSRDWFWGDDRRIAPFAGRGISIASGDPVTAWQRLDEERGEPWFPQREEAWGVISSCSANTLVIEDGVSGEVGEVIWFNWRNLLASARDQHHFERVTSIPGHDLLSETEIVVARQQPHPDFVQFDRFGDLGVWTPSLGWCESAEGAGSVQ